MFKLLPVILLAALLPLVGACGDDDSGTSDPGDVGVTLKDFSISLDKSTAPAGEVTFEIKNQGPTQHEFVVVRTELKSASLPYDDAKFAVVEDSPDVTPVDEKEAINKGDTTKLTVDLQPGHYVLFCNIPTHYSQGMRTDFTVQ